MISNLNISNSSLIILRKVPIRIISWITVVFVLLTCFFIFSLFFKFSYYLKYPAALYGNDLKITMDLKDLVKLNDYKLVIDKKTYDFKVKEVIENKDYYDVFISLDSIISYDFLDIYFKSEPTTLFKEFIKKIRKE